MKKKFDGQANKGGVYQIRNVKTGKSMLEVLNPLKKELHNIKTG